VDVGDGLVLRAPDAADADAVAEAINESLEHLRPWMAWATEPAVAADQALRLALGREAFDAGGDANYTWFDGDEVVGGGGIMGRQGPGVAEIGYWVRVGRTGRGIATRAVIALGALVWQQAGEGVDRIEIRCDEANVRSAAVARRAGFSHLETRTEPRTAPADTNRTMIWVQRRP
jgi:RimJ/RimL family protein N-acetyltransferase